MKGSPMQKVWWVVCRTFTARTIVCGPIAAQNSTHCWNQAIAMYCVCDQTQTNVESKLHYCDVQSGFRAKCAHCFSYAIRFYTKKVDENFSCRSNCLRVHHPLQKSVFIVLQLQTPTSIVITLVCGWKGSSKDKEVQKKSSVLSNLSSSVKLQTTSKVWVQSRQINKSRELCQETRRGCRK